MAATLIRPFQWVVIRLPSENVKVEQMVPNTTVHLGKFGSFKTNNVINRPFHLTWEILDKRQSREGRELRILSASEIHADTLLEEAESDLLAEGDKSDNATPNPDFDEYGLPTTDKSNVNIFDNPANQTLTAAEIEALKVDDMSNPKALIAKIMASHTTLDQKTAFSLAKYTLRKQRKYMKRFTVLPLNVSLMADWMMLERDFIKVMEIRNETLGLIGSWANIHATDRVQRPADANAEQGPNPQCRYLVVDDTGGLLVAAIAERMGLLHYNAGFDDAAAYQQESIPEEKIDDEAARSEVSDNEADEDNLKTMEYIGGPVATAMHDTDTGVNAGDSTLLHANEDTAINHGQKTDLIHSETTQQASEQTPGNDRPPKRHNKQNKRQHTQIPTSNTIHLIHTNQQPNLSLLRYFNFDINLVQPSYNPTSFSATTTSSFLSHPLYKHLKPLSWLQFLHPELDTSATPPPFKTPQELSNLKSGARSTYYRKLRRHLRCKSIIDETRAGQFDALVVATHTNFLSVLSHLVPLLAGGAQIVLYAPHIEPLLEVADAYSTARRSAFVNFTDTEKAAKLQEATDFKVDPTLTLGFTVQTARVKKWQVLPGRTHPLMTGRGGAEGYIAVATRVIPAEGKVVARGKQGRSRHKRKIDDTGVVVEIDVDRDEVEGNDDDHDSTLENTRAELHMEVDVEDNNTIYDPPTLPLSDELLNNGHNQDDTGTLSVEYRNSSSSEEELDGDNNNGIGNQATQTQNSNRHKRIKVTDNTTTSNETTTSIVDEVDNQDSEMS